MSEEIEQWCDMSENKFENLNRDLSLRAKRGNLVFRGALLL